jgi:hypothetical protein
MGAWSRPRSSGTTTAAKEFGTRRPGHGRKRPFDYFNEAIEKGWFWRHPTVQRQEPRVIFDRFEPAGRRQRPEHAAQASLAEAEGIVSRHPHEHDGHGRTTCAGRAPLRSRISYSTPHIMHLAYSDQAVPPRVIETSSRCRQLSKKIGQRASTQVHRVQGRAWHAAPARRAGRQDDDERLLRQR